MVILLAIPSKLAQLFPSIPRLIPKRTQEWQNGLFSCSPDSSCVLSLFLPDLLVKRTAARLRNSGSPNVKNTRGDCVSSYLPDALPCCGHNMTKRTEIRDKFGIKGSKTSDCCASYWCPCCSLVQQDNEVKTRLGPETSREGYQINPVIQMPQRDIPPTIGTSYGNHEPSDTPAVVEN
ncbi:hypothetical protein CEP53_008658 [Fusarium sp. AF-6]|nr:hypothetical protein CEP53_008658 [Fusarium sp. AF-6]